MLFDVLAALLLLATTLLAAALALTRSISSTRAAALQIAAVDLASDLTESLHGQRGRDEVLASWNSEIAGRLPLAAGELGDADDAGTYALLLSWRDASAGENTALRIPVVPPVRNLR